MVLPQVEAMRFPLEVMLHVGAALALGGCSVLATSAQPHRDRHGALVCDPYVTPVLDALVGLPLLMAGGVVGYLAVTDRDIRDEATPIVLPMLAVSIPLVISSVVGFQRDAACRRALP